MSAQIGEPLSYRLDWFETVGGFRLARVHDLDGRLLYARFSVPLWLSRMEAELEVYTLKLVSADHGITHEGGFTPEE